MDLKKNDIYQIEITGITSEGNGVGRANGTAVFVPHTACGDTVSVKIVKTAKNFAYGKALDIITPSPDRINSDCEASLKCGGCVFRHITYSAELEVKKTRVNDAMRRIGGFENLEAYEIFGAKCPDFYRNKAQIPISLSPEGEPIAGFFAPRSHRVISCLGCRLSPEEFNKITECFLSFIKKYNISVYNEQTGTGAVRHLYLRKGFETGEIMVCIVLNCEAIPHEKELAEQLCACCDGIKSIVVNVNKKITNVILGEHCRTVFGRGYINDILCGLKFKISPLSFYQVNHDQAQVLYSLAADFAGLNGSETLLDLYCGTGTIGLSMAHRAKSVIGAEIVPQAIEDARLNARENNINNARFMCADAARAAELLKKDGVRPDVIVLDPPRKGCAPELLDTIVQMQPQRIVYVSCDAATLARDIKILNQKGYAPQKLAAVDLFPRTSHVETVVLMSRK